MHATPRSESGSLQAGIHKVLKPLLTTRNQGRAMAAIRTLIAERHPSRIADQTLAGVLARAEAFIARSQDAFPIRGNYKETRKHVYEKQLVASMVRDFEGTYGPQAVQESNRGLHLTEEMSEERVFEVLTAAADPSRLPGGSLIASRQRRVQALAASGGEGMAYLRAIAASGGEDTSLQALTKAQTLDGGAAIAARAARERVRLRLN